MDVEYEVIVEEYFGATYSKRFEKQITARNYVANKLREDNVYSVTVNKVAKDD